MAAFGTPEGKAAAEDAIAHCSQRTRLLTEETTLINQLMSAIGTDAGLIGRNGRVAWKQNKDSATTDWKAAFTDLWNRVALSGTEGLEQLHDVSRDTIVAQFTTTKPGARPFRATFPKDD